MVLQVSGNCGVPAGASGVAGNLTVVAPSGDGFLELVPSGDQVAISTLSYKAGIPARANNFLLGLSVGGQLDLSSSITTNAIVDVTGYFLGSPCSFPTNCSAPDSGIVHNTLSPSQYPYTEDITFAGPVTMTSSACTISAPCTLSEICASLPGNVNASTTVNALLRAYVGVSTATAPATSKYAILLFVDGVQQDGANRLVKPAPFGEFFYGVAQNLTPGFHKFQLKGYMLGTGNIVLGLEYLHAIGAPTSDYPAAKDNNTDTLSVGSAWVQVTNTATLSLPHASDLALQGHLTLLSESVSSDPITVCFSLDGASCTRTSNVVNWQNVYPEDFNIMDTHMFVGAGTHNVAMWAHTGGGTATVQYRQIEAVSFPTDQGFISSYPDTVEIDTPTTIYTCPTEPCPTQPTALKGFNDMHGKWTKILSTTIPAITPAPAPNWDYEAYVETLAGPSGGSVIGELGFEFVQGSAAFDAGLSTFYIAPVAHDGIYKFGDSLFNGTDSPTTVNLWIRQQDYALQPCPSEPCTFQVGKRYMTVRLVAPDPSACLYQ
jgi:hypothetical protein